MSKEKRKRIVGVVAILSCVLGAYFIYEHLMYVSTDNAQVEARSVLMAPKVSGFIQKVTVDEGDYVKEGMLLVEIDSRDYENSLSQIQAERRVIEAQLQEANRNFQRLSSLFKSKAVSRAQYDQAETQLLEQNAHLQLINAREEQARLDLEHTKILAPSDGFIARRSAEVGQLASVGMPLLGFVDSNDRWVTANLKETVLKHIKIGAEAELDVDALKKAFKGKVQSISPATGASFSLIPPDNATGNFTKVVQLVPVRIEFENISNEDIEKLRAGLSVDVKIARN